MEASTRCLQIAGVGPCRPSPRELRDPARSDKPTEQASNREKAAETARVCGNGCVELQRTLHPHGADLGVDCPSPLFEKQTGNVDADRADLQAGSAQCRRVRQIRPLLEIEE
jgi:hypothetical protein